MGVGSGRYGGRGPLWIFMHATDIVDRGLIVLYFGHFFDIFWSPPPRKRLNSAIFRSFLLFLYLFSVAPPPPPRGKFLPTHLTITVDWLSRLWLIPIFEEIKTSK